MPHFFQCIPNVMACIGGLKHEQERVAHNFDNNPSCNSTRMLHQWYQSMSSRFCPRIEAMISYDPTNAEEPPSYPMSRILDQTLDSTWNRFIVCQLTSSNVDNGNDQKNPTKELWIQKKWQLDSLWESVCNKVRK